MRIGILTYHWVANMGANLQALSTYSYLLNQGHEPIIINWIPSDVEKYYIDNVEPLQITAHKDFASRYFKNITGVCRNSEEVAQRIIEHDIHFVCIGSDAVFSTKPQLSRWHLGRRGFRYIKPYSDATIENPFWGEFIKFLPNGYKITLNAISASAQNSPYKKIITKKEKDSYHEALKRFKTITVRDIWTQNMCRFVSRGQLIPLITPDPVFGFNQNVNPPKLNYVYEKLNIDSPYVLLSVSSSIKSEDWLLEFERLFRDKGITVVGLPKTNAPFREILKYNLEMPMNPMEWYDAIKYSNGYVGELMHPILVALHNSVPIFAFDTYGYKKNFKFDPESSKTYQIVKSFGLLNNYFNPLYNPKPTPSLILNSLLKTDSKEIQKKAESYLTQYNNMMKTILNSK